MTDGEQSEGQGRSRALVKHDDGVDRQIQRDMVFFTKSIININIICVDESKAL